MPEARQSGIYSQLIDRERFIEHCGNKIKVDKNLSVLIDPSKAQKRTSLNQPIDFKTMSGYSLEKLFFGAQKEYIESFVIPQLFTESK